MIKLDIKAMVAVAVIGLAGGAQALSLKDSIIYVLETNPEIKSAEANKQAIEFELQQARSFYAPRFELEAWAGSSLNDGNTIPDLSSADSAINGYELSARVSQMLYDGGDTRSEIERQAYRIDAAAYRVLERSEVLSLEAVRTYSDVLRSRQLLAKARENLAYHQDVYDRMQQAFDRGVVGIGDLQQAEERTIQAQDIIYDFELNLEDSRTLFLAVVGVEATGLQSVPTLGGAVPVALENALATARQRNPTILFLQSDVGASEALSRRVDANRYPTLSLEADARVGEDVGGFEGDVSDARIGFALRYQFQGTSKRAEREEHIRRASESRSQLLAQTRRVETEVRQSWSTLRAAQRRSRALQAQAELSRELRDVYTTEFEVGSRSLLDVLNTQAALFQSEVNLINARSLERYVEYRLLASIGVMLPTLGIEPPEDAITYARELERVPGLDATPDQPRGDAKQFGQWRRDLR